MSFESIPPHYFPESNPRCKYLEQGHCYWCCNSCNYNLHVCPLCGDPLDHNGQEWVDGVKSNHSCLED
jgi:hypothetical protein